VMDILDTPTSMKGLPQADPARVVESGAVAFEGVRFAYPSKPGVGVLAGIDFRIESGQTLALVGDTGAGKSTISHLISRFYDTTAGTVRVSGHDVRDFTLHQLRRGIALVPQDVVVFAGTIRENITLGADVPDARIHECLDAVCADTFVNRFEDGLDHIM